MFLKPVPKGPSHLTNVLLFIACFGTPEPTDHATFNGKIIIVLWGHQVVPDTIPLLKYNFILPFYHILKTLLYPLV